VLRCVHAEVPIKNGKLYSRLQSSVIWMHKQMRRTLIVMIGKTQAKRLIESLLERRGSSGAYGLKHFFPLLRRFGFANCLRRGGACGLHRDARPQRCFCL
jgi:hypothetical protein